MNINSPPGYSKTVISQLSTMRQDMEELQRQFGTGLKSTTYGGLGSERSLAISFRTKLERVQTYQGTVDLLDIRLKGATQTLTRMQAVVDETRKTIDPNKFDLLSDGVTAQQKTAMTALAEFVGLLNTEIGGRHMFGGRNTDAPPVESVDRILNGSGAQAGFKQVMSERRQADLGAGGLGRLTTGAAANVVTVAQDGTHPFGFKLGAATSTLSNATVTQPAGTPPSTTVTFAGQPKEGETLRLTLKMPDGTDTTVEVKVGSTTDAAKGTFAIGATADDTAANLNTALAGQIALAAKSELTVASAVEASKNFFGTFAGQAPMRVDGPPFDTATQLVAGTEANTLAWYKGENGASPAAGWTPRADVQAAVDTNIDAAYGMRANEEAFTWNIRQMAVMVTTDLSAGGADAKALQSSLASKLRANLGSPPGTQTLTAVHMEITGAYKATDMARERHTQSAGTLESFLAGIEGVDKNEVGVKLLALQTQMQASYQATSILYKMSLADYI